jgi:hypothetical protein
MEQSEARYIIESLRSGLPPNGHVCQFTIGRESEISELAHFLQPGKAGALLLRANYGSGKSHLLRYIREHALQNNFAVSLIALDAKAAVRFNKMDQIFGTILRNIELPGWSGKGPNILFGALEKTLVSPGLDKWRRDRLQELTNAGSWDYSELLRSPGLFIGIRAWVIARKYPLYYRRIPDEVGAWLCAPWSYRATWLKQYLVTDMHIHFRDPRSSFGGAFNFSVRDFKQAWDALADLHLLSKLVGTNGLVLLVDEFEDVIHNLNGRNAKTDAFWNLFLLFKGVFPGHAFFAVTPDFVNKCKAWLFDKWQWRYDLAQFDDLPYFEMSPLRIEDLEVLAEKIMFAHAAAYGWQPKQNSDLKKLRETVHRAARVQVQDRSRYAVRQVVKQLDDLLEDSL